MRKFLVTIPWHATHYVEVWANNKKEAIEKGLEEASPYLCCHCSKDICLDEFNSSEEVTASPIKENSKHQVCEE